MYFNMETGELIGNDTCEETPKAPLDPSSLRRLYRDHACGALGPKFQLSTFEERGTPFV